MIKLVKASALVFAMTSVAACSGDPEAPEADTVTETRMDEVDVIDGTISDDMVDVDAQATGDELAEGTDEDGKTADNDKQDSEESDE